MPPRGRPRQYADEQEGTRIRVQRYREQQKHPRPESVPPGPFQNIFLAWDPRQPPDPTLPTDDPPDIFTDLQAALDAVPLDRGEAGPPSTIHEESLVFEDAMVASVASAQEDGL
jgi:hypothetical protein